MSGRRSHRGQHGRGERARVGDPAPVVADAEAAAEVDRLEGEALVEELPAEVGESARRRRERLDLVQAQWVTGAIVANDTVWLAYDAPYNGTINALTYFTGNGSFSVAIQINGTNVTGLGAVAVSSATPATTNATAANTFTAGQRITAVITAATGSPTDALLSLAVTWS